MQQISEFEFYLIENISQIEIPAIYKAQTKFLIFKNFGLHKMKQ